MAESFSFVHLSDLHFSHGALLKGDHSHSIERLKEIDRILADLSFDRLLLTGDISNRGDAESLNQAKEWLFDSFGIGEDKRTGLRLSHDQVILIPGNHDAYDCTSATGKLPAHRQKSLTNFNYVFSHYSFKPDEDSRYYWLQKNDEAVFIVAVDSSFLGDKSSEHLPGLKEQVVSHFSEIARGRWSSGQAEQVLQWFDMGMKGRLAATPDKEDYIPKELFARSFKMLLMHHYIFEPPEFSNSISLRLVDRKTVFRNLAMADFDMLLCGHKHVAAFHPQPYGAYFIDRRSRGRYLVNLFRRLIGIHTMPDQYSDEKGLKIGKRVGDLISILMVKGPRRPKESVPQYLERLLNALQSVLENPKKWRTELGAFVGPSQSDDAFQMDANEVKDIVRQLTAQLGRAERIALKKIAGNIKGTLAGLDARPFVQSMCGSSAKSVSSNDKRRSFSTYDIVLNGGEATVTQKEYAWEAGANGFALPFERKHEFRANRRVAF